MNVPYDSGFSPPAPILSIRLYSFLQDQFSDPFPALIDTGSDTTLIPLRRLVEIGAKETAPGWLVGVTGDRRPVATYYIDIALDGLDSLMLPGIRVIASTTSDEALLGRDVLNRLSLFLDGPRESLHIPDDAMINRLRSSYD